MSTRGVTSRQDDFGLFRMDGAKFIPERLASKLGYGTGQFYAGGPGANDNEPEPCAPLRRVGDSFGHFEGIRIL